MNALTRLVAAALVFAGIASAGSARADYVDPVSRARLSVSPDPLPVNQESAATLFIPTRADVHGFNGMGEPAHVPVHQIVGQRLDLFFPTSCSFICQNLPITLVSHPFRLPPLSAGMHTVRIIAGSGPDVLAEFSIAVGGAPSGNPAAISLPVGSALAMGLLGSLLIITVWIRTRPLAARQTR